MTQNQQENQAPAVSEWTDVLGMAAASSAAQAARLLDMAKARCELTGEEIALRVGVTPGRVSQVLNGDGNFHVATLARYITAMGYTLELRAHDPLGAELTPRVRRRGRSRKDAVETQTTVYDLTFGGESGLWPSELCLEYSASESQPPELIDARPRRAPAWVVSGDYRTYEEDFRAAAPLEGLVASEA